MASVLDVQWRAKSRKHGKFIAEWEGMSQNKQTYPICTLPEFTKIKFRQSKGEVNERLNWQQREETQQKEM